MTSSTPPQQQQQQQQQQLHPDPPLSTSSHPPSDRPDATHTAQNSGFSAPSASSTAELSSLKVDLRRALRRFPDFPQPGILFEDILPIFANPSLHAELIRALELHILSSSTGAKKPDIIVGLEARGFLFGPTLALRLGASFVPLRKKGKLPGPTVTATYKKEYGEDVFEMQSDAIKPGQTVLVVDDLIATGGSAACAEQLVSKLGGVLIGHIFIIELGFLKGRDKLNAPVYTLLNHQDGTSSPE
ncbi:MAG: adenine phosphoribosyltransferase [Sarea resinae]|nr:MAG: adenine phosphoribosyltransferase [Sarea resinae]